MMQPEVDFVFGISIRLCYFRRELMGCDCTERLFRGSNTSGHDIGYGLTTSVSYHIVHRYGSDF